MDSKKNLLDKFREKSAVIGIYGLGYVGLPLAIRYAESGFKVVGFDVDETKVLAIAQGKSYIKHISSQSVAHAVSAGFEATSNFARSAEVDALIICVPTPLTEHREPDLSFVVGTVERIIPFARPGQVMSLESTTYPGTTEEELVKRVAAAGFTVGQDYFVVYSPEREDPGNPHFTTRTIPKVCGGTTAACLEVGVALYEGVIDRVVPVSSTKAAEMTKLLENIHRAVNIGLVNEMKVIADLMGIDIFEVIEAASSKPFGFVPYRPGPGLGGHCIPIDPFYLTWKAKEYDFHTRFIELAGEVNGAMPAYVVGKVAQGLNMHKKPVNGSKILVLGIAYKKNVDDMRESPSVVIIERLMQQGAHVDYHDDFVPVFPKMRKHSLDLKSVPLTERKLREYDCVVIATDHDYMDYELIGRASRLVVDARGRFGYQHPNVVMA